MRLRIVKGDTPGKVIALTDMVFTIGRELDNQYVIHESGVSRHHCTISRIGKEWFVEDQNSINGVLVNEVRISSGTALKPGDRITVFNHEFVFLDDQADFPVSNVAKAVAAPVLEQNSISVPWGKILLLLAILGLVAYLAVKVFAPEEDSAAKVAVMEALQVEDPVVDATALALSADDAAVVPATTPQNRTESIFPSGDKALSTPADSLSTKPAVREREDLERPAPLSSEVVLADSDPAGAEVYLDGEQQEGFTPLLLRKVAPGRHSLELRKSGYENSIRTIHVPDIQPSRPTVLRQKSATLFLQSNPSGAHVWQERKFLGVTPFLLENLEPGSHELILRGPGCELKKVSVEIQAARGEKLTVELQSNLGNLEVLTQPGNCKVYLQGVLMGVTREEPGQSKSYPLLLQNILAGEQRLKIEHSSGVSVSGRIQVPRNDTVQKSITLRIPTHRLLLNTGEVCIGIVLEQNEQGDVVLEDMNKKAKRYLKPQIKECRLLNDAEIQEALATARKGSGGKDGDVFGGRGDMLSVMDLRRAMLSMPAEDFNRVHQGKVYNLVGKPSMILPESKGVTVMMFTTNLKCQFSNIGKEEIEELNSVENNSISFQGTCSEIGKDGVLVLKNCILLSEF